MVPDAICQSSPLSSISSCPGLNVFVLANSICTSTKFAALKKYRLLAGTVEKTFSIVSPTTGETPKRII